MAQESFLRILQCPCCGGGLELEWRDPTTGPEVEFGTLRCQCYRYGIVLGIVVIRQYSPPQNNKDPIVAELDKHEYSKAVDLLLARGLHLQSKLRTAIASTAGWLTRQLRGGNAARPTDTILMPSEDLRAALRRLRPGYYGEYLYHRYANPSLLAAIPVIAAIAEILTRADAIEPRWAIDIGCGIGQTAYLLKTMVPQTRMVAADLDFLNLLFAKHYALSDASFICFDAEVGLPFKDSVFRTSFSLDCIHYIRCKKALAKDLRRVGQPDALYAISHLHNANRSNPNPGIPLSADGYLEVLEPLGGSLYAESTLLESFSRTGFLALDAAADDLNTLASNAFVYLTLGARSGDLTSARVDQYIAQYKRHLYLNELYESVRVNGALELRLRWPSEKLRDECCVDFQPLCEKIAIAPRFAASVLAHDFRELPTETLGALIRSFVIVPRPPGGLP